MIEAALHAAGVMWEHLLESLWRSDHGGKSLEKEEPPKGRALWPRVWPFLLATIVVAIYLAMILKLGGMKL
jgi:hypothetical protein